ncbi:hypothetical protein [Pseudonocardia sp. GCM10023141]|uniref:hypothetical protein n=1 Tax=Pseudonocardia sp. GCM10023141 TaxID=3252653 RepID=UPI0036114E21
MEELLAPRSAALLDSLRAASAAGWCRSAGAPSYGSPQTLRRNVDKLVGTTATAYRSTFRGAAAPAAAG